jgi:hypothetical protein
VALAVVAVVEDEQLEAGDEAGGLLRENFALTVQEDPLGSTPVMSEGSEL